ncbi:hypothetical protein A0257_13815 [Hymenobacter psoromatis]|nr:hypothetical protein A0257_13815 [Hymenobacter psoromatis]
MKQLILLGSLWLLAGNQLVWAAPPVLADTIAGQTQLARVLAAEACQQLAAGPGQALTELSPTQAQEAFEQALSQTIEKRVAAIRQVAKQANTAGAYEKLRADLPTVVAVHLIRTCPTATQLYGRFINSAAAEDAFIKSWGEELCQRLATLQATGLLKNKSSAERVELFHQEFNASLTRRGPQIMQLYGAAGNSQPVVARLASRVMEDLQQQCLPTLMLLKDSK